MAKDCKSCKGNNWSILVKPTHMCNFDCKYCYDEPFRRKFKNTVMSMETLNEILKRAAKHTKNLSLIWHGGEPLTVGKQWYIDAQKIIALHPELKVSQQLQTNASLLDEEWAVLASMYNIEIGASFDGPFQAVRDNRVDKVETAIDTYRESGGTLGFICVVNQENYTNLIEIYKYFKEKFNANFSFNRVFDSAQADKNGLMITVEDYQREYMKFYDYWVRDIGAVGERSILEITNHVMGFGSSVCSHSNCLYNWLGVNPIGELYPCDRYIPDRYNLGKITEYDTIKEAYESEAYALYSEENTTRMIECIECDYGHYCGGGCVANHIGYAGDATKNDPEYCLSYKMNHRDVYEYWREFDVENEYINQELVKLFIDGPIFTVKEIREVINMMIPNVVLNYDRDVEGLIKCSEYKVFRLINNIKKSAITSHTDTVIHELEVDIYVDDPGVMWEVREVRHDALKTIVLENIDKILNITSEGV